jgi:hypothetical protein
MLVYDATEPCGKENTHWNMLPNRRLVFPEYGRVSYLAANNRELAYIIGLIPDSLAIKSVKTGEGEDAARNWYGDAARRVAAILVNERQPND